MTGLLSTAKGSTTWVSSWTTSRQALAFMKEKGYSFIQAGAGQGLKGDGGFAYFDLEEEVNTVVELIEIPADREENPRRSSALQSTPLDNRPPFQQHQASPAGLAWCCLWPCECPVSMVPVYRLQIAADPIAVMRRFSDSTRLHAVSYDIHLRDFVSHFLIKPCV